MGKLLQIAAQQDAATVTEAPLGRTSNPGNVTPLNARGVPVNRLSDSFENFDLSVNGDMEAARDRCRAVAEGREWCAFLTGGFGNGKTHLAIAALNLWAAEHLTGYFWKTPDFLQYLRDLAFNARRAAADDGLSRFGDGIGIDAAIEPYSRGHFLLVLDDLGTENPTAWAEEQLYRVLDSRYDGCLSTIITTNRDIGRIDGRILSRFREGLVVCEGRDVRAAVSRARTERLAPAGARAG